MAQETRTPGPLSLGPGLMTLAHELAAERKRGKCVTESSAWLEHQPPQNFG